MGEHFTQISRASIFIFCFMLAGAKEVVADAPPIWLKPAIVSTGDTAVVVDGEYAIADSLEYVKGKRIPLQNWMGDWGNFSPPDGELYIQLNAPNSPVRPSRLYVGVKIPRFWNQNTGIDTGMLDLYLAFNDQYCSQAEDRVIRMVFNQQNAEAASPYDPSPTLTWDVFEYKGNDAASCWNMDTLGSTPPVHRKSRLGIDEFDDKTFLFAEFEIAVPPSVFNANQLRLGVKYVDEDYGSAQCPRCCSAALTLPNNPFAQQGTPDQLDWGRESTYQLFDLKEPALTELGVSTYNVGQMLDAGVLSVPQGDLAELSDALVENGGVADPEDIAKAIWSRDIVCLAEVMMFDDRKEIVERANKIRRNHNLPPFTPVMVNDDKSPNVMILSWWQPLLKAEVKNYKELDSTAGGPDDQFFGSTRGAKGVAWARLGAPPKCKFGPPYVADGCPENAESFDAHQWIDVFCTHTQAPCSPAPPIGSDPICANEKDQHLNSVRQKQFEVLAKYIKEKRALKEPFGSGLDRPALLLGDLNQVGPRGRSDNWGNNGNMNGWLNGNEPLANNDIYEGNKPQIALAYKSMRTKLGNWERTEFDRRLADEYISGYDLTANTHLEGTWIGEEHKGQTSKKRSDECTSSFPDLRNEPRIDYIMLLPAQEKFPAWSVRWTPGKPAYAQVDRHFKSTPDLSTEEEGCLSDHAEVMAQVQLVPVAEPGAVNPFREKRLFYSAAQLYDVDNEDDTFGDDGTTDWYTENFFLETSDGSGNVTGRCQSNWGTNITPHGRTVTPGWRYRSYPMKGKDTALVWLEVKDKDAGWDDYYDSHSRSPCKHTEIVFDLEKLEASEQGCGMNYGHVIEQGKGVAWLSKGNGDDDIVQILNVFSLCDVKQDPGCDLLTGP